MNQSGLVHITTSYWYMMVKYRNRKCSETFKTIGQNKLMSLEY